MVAEGFAHAILTLEDDTQAIYQASNFFHPPAERGVRFDDGPGGWRRVVVGRFLDEVLLAQLSERSTLDPLVSVFLDRLFGEWGPCVG